MPTADVNGITLHYRIDGDPNGAPLVFINALGTTLDIWDQVIDLLPDSLRIIRFDNRGHGGSDSTPGAYSMGMLVRDTERLLDHLEVKDAVIVGLSIGGMITQGLAVKRLDLVRGIVLSNTAAKIGQPGMWHDRIASVQKGGMEALTPSTMERWFTKAFREGPEFPKWRDMFLGTSIEGYAGCANAIAGTDFYTPTASLRLPTLGIGGYDDGSTPHDMVQETVGLIPGSKFHLIRKAGHIPCVEKPEEYATVLLEFLASIGHVSTL